MSPVPHTPRPPRRPHPRRGGRGFTLIELMVTITIMAILLMMAVPPVMRALQNARTAALVHRLPQDVAWARNRSATSPTPYRIVLGPGCQWQTQQASFAGGALAWSSTAETNVRSMPAATAAAAHPQATCSLSGGATQHVTFDGQGLIADNAPTVTIASGNGQTWTLQILLSGLVLLNAQTSS